VRWHKLFFWEHGRPNLELRDQPYWARRIPISLWNLHELEKLESAFVCDAEDQQFLRECQKIVQDIFKIVEYRGWRPLNLAAKMAEPNLRIVLA